MQLSILLTYQLLVPVFCLQKGDAVHASIVDSLPLNVKAMLQEQNVVNITKVGPGSNWCGRE